MSTPIEIDPRVALAAERTLLAWIRTGVAMMGFGFVVARFGMFLRELASIHSAPAEIRSSGTSLWIGTALVVLGAATNLLATLEYRRFLRALEAGETRVYRGTWSMAVIVAVLLALIGLAMAGYLLAVGHRAPPPAQLDAAARRPVVTSSFSATGCPSVVC